MSPIRHTGRHRKPRRSRVTKLFHGGVLSGVLSTVAVAAPAGAAPPPPEEPPAESTGEIPVLHGLLTTSAAQAAEATERYAAATDLEQAQQRALRAAERAAAERKAEEQAAAEAAAQAEAEAAAAREAEAAEAAASRSSARAESLAADAEEAPETAGDSTPSAAAAPAPSSGSAVVDFARSQLGAGYQLGANGPSAWDCSSLTQAAYAAAGVSLPRTSQQQSTAGTQIPVSEAQPGDLLYWGGAGSAHHVAIYVGDGRFIGAQNPSTGVVEQDLSWSPPTGAIRIG